MPSPPPCPPLRRPRPPPRPSARRTQAEQLIGRVVAKGPTCFDAELYVAAAPREFEA